jgi:uncharacterized protein (TIGR03437 family)
MTIHGSNLARFMTDVGSSFAGASIPTSFNGVQVTLAGRAVPLLTLAPGYIVAQVPVDAPTGSQPLRVQTAGGTSESYNVMVANVAPAVFFDREGGLVTDAMYNLVGRQGRPAPRNIPLHVFSTGLGVVRQQEGTLGTGMFPNAGLWRPDEVTVMVDGRAVQNASTIALPGFVGLYQTTFMVPLDTRTGTVPLQIRSGSAMSNTVNILVQ